MTQNSTSFILPRAPRGRQNDGIRQQDDRETHEVALRARNPRGSRRKGVSALEPKGVPRKGSPHRTGPQWLRHRQDQQRRRVSRQHGCDVMAKSKAGIRRRKKENYRTRNQIRRGKFVRIAISLSLSANLWSKKHSHCMQKSYILRKEDIAYDDDVVVCNFCLHG